MSDLVSVIIPTRNRSDLILNAIKSVTSQTYKKIEIIIVSDGSTDDTVQVLNKYFNKDNNIKIIALDSCVGAAEARNIGINNSKGEYIAFLDDDDLWKNTKLEKQLNIFREFPDTALVTCYYSKEKNGELKTFEVPLFINSEDILYNNYPGSFSFCLIKREYIFGIIIKKTLKKAQDWYLWINILNKTGKVCRTVPENLVYYNTKSINRITQYNLMAHFSRIEFYRTVWHLMNNKQKYYNLRILYNEKNSVNNIPLIKSFILSLVSLRYHIKSNYKIKLGELLRDLIIIKKIFKKMKHRY